jgi:hypothetical protein
MRSEERKIRFCFGTEKFYVFIAGFFPGIVVAGRKKREEFLHGGNSVPPEIKMTVI